VILLNFLTVKNKLNKNEHFRVSQPLYTEYPVVLFL